MEIQQQEAFFRGKSHVNESLCLDLYEEMSRFLKQENRPVLSGMIQEIGKEKEMRLLKMSEFRGFVKIGSKKKSEIFLA